MITVEKLQKLYLKKGIKWDKVNIFGIRFEENQELDTFNDVLGIATNNDIQLAEGTTDPGWQATKNRIGGAAHLCLGHHKDIWLIDKHAKGRSFEHEAFCQYAGSVTIWRDIDKDSWFSHNDSVESGYFGINMHRASIRGSEHIGPYGAGCQVHKNPETLKIFLDIAKKSGQKVFSYTLFDKKEIA